MSEVYADHPFELIPSPKAQLAKGEKEDMFDALATEMCCVHNMLIRGLNSIYLQAPHIEAKDVTPFLHYMEQWSNVLHSHHTGEEEAFFPELERLTGEKGMMDGNVEQHHAFEKGVEQFGDYIRACLAGKDKYDGGRVVSLIDGFGAVLRTHLADEIPTLLALRKHADKLAGISESFAKEGEKHMREVGMLRGAVWCLVVHDLGFEDGIHAGFPPAPGPILWFLRNLGFWLHSDWWKFAPCDRLGNLRPLPYAAGSEPKH